MRSLANRLVTASFGESIEVIGSGSVQNGDIAIGGTGSAVNTNYYQNQPGWTLVSKILGGQWNGPSTPQYQHWAGLYYKVIAFGDSNIVPAHDRTDGPHVYRLNKPIVNVVATQVATSNYVQTRTFNDPNDDSDAYIAVDFVNFWNPPTSNLRTTNVQPDNLSYAGNYTGRGVYAKGFLTGSGVSITNSGGDSQYNGSLHPSITTLLKLYV